MPAHVHQMRGMTTTVLKNLVVLARMLERLERSAVRVDAQQYRTVVRHLARELAMAPNDQRLDTLLEGFPETAELFENLHYAHAGLCRSPLDKSLPAELDAREFLAGVQRRAAGDA
jgi:hypothetical protein